MPDYATHYYFGQEVLSALPKNISAVIDQGLYDFALSGPDDWALYRFYIPWLRHGKNERAQFMHNQKCGDFLSSLIKEPALFSYTAGFLCHYVLDSTCHPYINAFSGEYLATPETIIYRGNHMAFEHAIDNSYLLEYSNFKKHPISKEMTGKLLPQSLEHLINKIYFNVFGWQDVFKDLNEAKKGLRTFLWFAEDPHKVLKVFTNLFSHPTLRAVPYSRKYYANADIRNVTHQQWHYPQAPDIISTESFDDLFEKAKRKAVHLISLAFVGDSSEIGNTSYVTGLELTDPRANALKTFTPLERY